MMNEEQATTLRHSEHWGWIVKELEFRLSSEMRKLRNVSTVQLAEQQARVNFIEEFMRLPDDVLDREAAPTVTDSPQSSPSKRRG